MREEDSIYYVYVYLDVTKSGIFKYNKYEFDFEPFYVGYGKRNRYISHLNEAKRKESIRKGNKHKFYKIKSILSNNLEPIIIKQYKNLFFDDAKKLEIEMITDIGRCDLQNGPLTNLTDGGDFGPDTSGEKNAMFGLTGSLHPASDWVKNHRTEQWTELQRESHLGEKNPIYGKYWTDEQKINHSKKLKEGYKSGRLVPRWTGRKHSEESLKKMSDALSGKNNPMYGKQHSDATKKLIGKVNKESGIFKGKNNPRSKIWKFIDPSGNEYIVEGGFDAFCKEHNLKTPKLLRLAGNQNIPVKSGSCKGWMAIDMTNN
jgi:hypothetical protein